MLTHSPQSAVQNIPTEDRFLTVEDAAARLQVSVFTMRRYLRAGKLHAVKLGKAWRVPEGELRRLATAQPRVEKPIPPSV